MILELAAGAFIIGNFVYHRWIEDHPKPHPNAVGTPRVDEGAPVPLIYGKCRVRAPILAWCGSQRSVPRPNARFAYFLDMLYVVGIPFYGGAASLHAIYAGDRLLVLNVGASWPFTSDTSPWTCPVNGDSHAYKGNYWVNNTPARVFQDDLEILVNYGFVEFFTGSPDQVLSDGIVDDDDESLTDTQAMLEAEPFNSRYVYLNEDHDDTVLYEPPLNPNIPADEIPSYRHFVVCSMYRWCNGDRTELANYSFEVSSLSSMFGHTLGSDADPAAVIYDLLTSPFGKLALPTSKVDLPSFQAASDTLLGEEHGYSRAIEQSTDATEIIGDILRQVDGLIYEEPTTGKLVIKLIRLDYDVSQLDDVNPDNTMQPESGWYSVQGWNETLNQVRVTFTDRQNAYVDGLAIGQNIANIVAQGGKLRSVDIRFPGCTTAELAKRLASRELAAVSRPIAKATVTVNRSFYQKRPGDVVTLTWPELSISKMAMRVVRVDLGQLHAGAIRLDLIRDLFDVSLGAF